MKKHVTSSWSIFIQLATGVHYALFPLLKRQSVLRAEKLKICKTINRTTGNVRSRISDNE